MENRPFSPMYHGAQDGWIEVVATDGRPAPAEGPTIHVGGAESYEARCRRCHHVPARDRAQGELEMEQARALEEE